MLGEFKLGLFWVFGRVFTWGWEEGGPLVVLGGGWNVGGLKLGWVL